MMTIEHIYSGVPLVLHCTLKSSVLCGLCARLCVPRVRDSRVSSRANVLTFLTVLIVIQHRMWTSEKELKGKLR